MMATSDLSSYQPFTLQVFVGRFAIGLHFTRKTSRTAGVLKTVISSVPVSIALDEMKNATTQKASKSLDRSGCPLHHWNFFFSFWLKKKYALAQAPFHVLPIFDRGNNLFAAP